MVCRSFFVQKKNRSDQGSAFRIFECTTEDHDKIDKSHDTAKTAGQQHEDTGTDFPHIETVDAHASEKEAQQRGDSFGFIHFF